MERARRRGSLTSSKKEAWEFSTQLYHSVVGCLPLPHREVGFIVKSQHATVNAPGGR